ncbi:m99L [Myxoma virus]|nr:m99L [Myxoma virus]AQT35439.1 m99L [Myxoma virus]AQT35609.1 m99L [Myxoma virus]AQT35779.1 m99L [Myxoma virus]
MIPINSITTLDQLEDSEYLFKVISTILPSICLDFKVDEDLKTNFVHPFDVLINPKYGETVDLRNIQNSVQKIGINYLLDRYSSIKLFTHLLQPGYIATTAVDRYDAKKNVIINTHTFNDLPNFTKDLVMFRLRSPEKHARFLGGYLPPEQGGFDAMVVDDTFDFEYPNLAFENTYALNLLYKNVIKEPYGILFRARVSNGIMFYRDFANLLGVRGLLDGPTRDRFDENYNMQQMANHYNLALPAFNPARVDLLTMSTKHAILHRQYFNDYYIHVPYTYNGDVILDSTPSIISILVSMRFQRYIPKLQALYPNLPTMNAATVTVRDQNRVRRTHNLNMNIHYVDISGNVVYFITLLNMLAKEHRTDPLSIINPSMFWDGIDYETYKTKKISEIIFYNATCYVFGLYNKDGTTYCSMLTDIIAANQTPLRVCFLPRTLSGRTVPKLVSEVLESVNTTSRKEFPKKPASKLMHIGLSENNFMRFFQLLRLITNRTPEAAIKEVLVLYAGFKIHDTGTPHLIKKESYQDFVILLFSAMGFKVQVKKSVIGSNNHTVISIRPRVSKQYINNMLMKSSCSKDDADKLISATHDLLHFMVSAGDYKDYQSYYYARYLFPTYFFGGNSNDETADDETIIHLTERMNMLDRINIRGIFSANTTDELLTVDAFGPENVIFKNNLKYLIQTNQLTGDSITQTMPLNILDKLVTTAGVPCSVSLNDVIDNISNDTDDCDSTNDITDLINTALKETYTKRNTSIVSQSFGAVANQSQKQLEDFKQSTCRMATIFKHLARSIYTVERIFNTRISDEVKLDILEKLKAFSSISRSLYTDLISVETLKAILYIIKQSGRSVERTEIGPDEIRKSYEIIKPKIINMTNYYTQMSRDYFNFMKKNLNMRDDSLASFDTE